MYRPPPRRRFSAKKPDQFWVSKSIRGRLMYWRLLIFLCFIAAGASRLDAQSSTISNVYVFPLFADGTAGGTSYRSTVKVTKTSAPNPLQCTLVQRNTSAPFTGIDGFFYSADVLDAGFSPPAQSLVILDQFLPFEILRTNAQAALKTGYAKLTC